VDQSVVEPASKLFPLPPRARRRRAWLGWQSLLLPIALLGLWETVGERGWISTGILPPPSLVATGFVEWAFGTNAFGFNNYSGTWLTNVLFSAQRVAEGFALAVVVGLPLGVLIGWSRVVERVVDPTVQALRPVPITAWLPFCIAVFGIRAFGAIFLIALGAFYPIVVNGAAGARDVNRNLLRAARMMGATRLQLLRLVVVPSAMPAIFTGLRIGLGVAWTAVVVAEMVAVKSGLGYVLWDAYYIGRMDVVIADMVSIGLAGFLSDQLILFIEARVLAWKRVARD